MKYAWLLLFAIGCTPPGKPAPPLDDGQPGSVKDFDRLYKTNCAGCHGADGTLGPAPPLNDPLFLYFLAKEDYVQETVQDGHKGTAMPAFGLSQGGSLTQEQVKILAAGLFSKWARVPPPSIDLGIGKYSNDGDVTRGKLAYVKACANCHGANGEGGNFENKAIGAINSPAYLALASNKLLWRIIITGRPDLGMPNFTERTGRAADYNGLTSREINDLTAFLASWRTKP